MRILLTGGSGMVGQNLLAAPGAGRHEVLAPPRSELDLLSASDVHAFLRQNHCDLIIHAAGRVGGIQANLAAPVEFLLENLEMGMNVVVGARQERVPRLLNLASSCMYPRGIAGAISENQVLSGRLEPTNEGYALAKVVVQRLCAYVTQQHSGLLCKTLVPCNLFGRHDKFSLAAAHLVAAAIVKIHRAKLQGEPTVEIWGDGQARREFLYAGDLANLVWHAVERFDQLPPLLNLGVGLDHSIDDYYHAVAQVIGYQGEFTHDLSRPVGMRRKLLDVSRMSQLRFPPLHMLPETLRWTYEFYLGQSAMADLVGTDPGLRPAQP